MRTTRASLQSALGLPCAALLFLACGPAKGPKRPTGDPALQRVARMARFCREGARLWRDSCTGREVHGICVAPGARLRAGALPAPSDLRPRRSKQARAALAAYAEAWKMWEDGRATSHILVTHPRRTEMAIRIRECAAEAAFVRVEPAFVAYLRTIPPTDLDLNPEDPARAKASMAAFRRFLTKRLKSGDRLMKRYMKVITKVRVILKSDGIRRGSPVWAVAAIARIAQVLHDFAHTLAAIPIPAFLTAPAAREAFRAQLLKIGRPLREKARARYRVCLQVQKKLKVPAHLPWVQLCRQALTRMPPSPKR